MRPVTISFSWGVGHAWGSPRHVESGCSNSCRYLGKWGRTSMLRTVPGHSRAPSAFTCLLTLASLSSQSPRSCLWLKGWATTHHVPHTPRAPRGRRRSVRKTLCRTGLWLGGWGSPQVGGCQKAGAPMTSWQKSDPRQGPAPVSREKGRFGISWLAPGS